MDWDWEDGPPRDAPRPRPEEPSQRPAPDTTFSGAVEHFERPRPRDDEGLRPDRDAERPADFDDDRTQIIRRPDAAPEPGAVPEAAPVPAARPDGGRQAPDGRSFAAEERPTAGRRPRTPADRAAARARRRRQIRRRRLTALAVLVVIIVLLVVLVVRGCGGSDEGQAAGLGPAPTSVAFATPADARPQRPAVGGESAGDGAPPGSESLMAVLAGDRRLAVLEEGL